MLQGFNHFQKLVQREEAPTAADKGKLGQDASKKLKEGVSLVMLSFVCFLLGILLAALHLLGQ